MNFFAIRTPSKNISNIEGHNSKKLKNKFMKGQEDLKIQKQYGLRPLEETESHSNLEILGNSWVETLMLRTINILNVTVVSNHVHLD